MKTIDKIPPKHNQQGGDTSLRVAAYCRVSTDHDEQDGSIEAQELHYPRVIEDYPDRERLQT